MATDILGAVYDFLTQTISPAPVNIVRGWQNRAALPNASAFVVLTLIAAPRRGTNVHTWADTEGADTGITETVSMLSEYSVQVDFCGLDAAAVMAQASQLVMFARDAVGVDFFNAQGLSCLYADDPVSLPYSNELDQWVTRYSVTLHLSGWVRGDIQHDSFSDVTLNIENVDVHHPITETGA